MFSDLKSAAFYTATNQSISFEVTLRNHMHVVYTQFLTIFLRKAFVFNNTHTMTEIICYTIIVFILALESITDLNSHNYCFSEKETKVCSKVSY